MSHCTEEELESIKHFVLEELGIELVLSRLLHSAAHRGLITAGVATGVGSVSIAGSIAFIGGFGLTTAARCAIAQ